MRAVLALGGAGLLMIAWVVFYCARRSGTPHVATTPPRSEYVQPASCAGCHPAIWKTYQQTGMGRSFSRVRQERLIEDFTRNNRFHHGASGRHYTMYERGGAIYQRREQVGPGGEIINEFEKRADYILGSGNHSRSYLYRGPGGRLYQLPVSWYSERGGFWAMSPGYDRADHKDFRRAVTYDCLFCHTGYPPDAPAALPGDDPVFPEALPEGIDCQRCHGPGRAHVGAASAKQPAEAVRAAILNPKRVRRERQLEVCMQCHLETTSRPLPYSIVRYQRGLFSYRPDQALPGYILHFDHPAGAGYDDKFEIAHAAYRLRGSACFIQSDALTCTTCHNPHKAPRGAEAVTHYRDVCRSCHTRAHRAAEDCAACHMPKRRTDDVVHVVMTDHWIQRRKPARDLLAPLRERPETEQTAYRGEVAPYYPREADELYVAAAQVAEGSNLKGGIPRLEAAIARYRPSEAQFYFALAEAHWKSGKPAKAVQYYEDALRRRPGHRAALRNLGVALRAAGDPARAAQVLERAPDDAAALATLGDVYAQMGRLADAERVLRKAISLDPESPEALTNLGQVLARKGDRSGAVAALREAIRVRPDFAVAHNNLANQLEGEEARYHFEQAIQHDPAYAEAHYNYGTALAARQRWQQAERHLLEAVRLNPRLAEAHNNLGNLYVATGQPRRAVESFRKTLECQPALDSVRLNLAVALASLGRAEEAAAELQKVAASPDPQVRDLALKGLRQLGR